MDAEASPPGDTAPNSVAAPSGAPPTQRAVEYKGAPLDADKGPGLAASGFQVVVLVIVVVLTPLSAAWEWPVPVTIVLLALTLVLLLFVGQTVIFLLRLVAADRRATGRRRPMQSGTQDGWRDRRRVCSARRACWSWRVHRGEPRGSLRASVWERRPGECLGVNIPGASPNDSRARAFGGSFARIP